MSAGAKDLPVFAGACALAALPAAWGGLWAPVEVAAVGEPGLLVSAARSAFGASPLAARLPGLLCVALTAWLTYRLGAHWLGRARGLVAAAVLLTCPLVLLQGARLVGDAPRMLVETLVVAAACLAIPRFAAAAAFLTPLAGAALASGPAQPEFTGLDAAVRHVGLGLFPWICLLPGALGARVFHAGDADDGEAPPDALTAWACGGLLAAAAAATAGRPPLLTAAPAMALLVAAWPGPRGRAEIAVAVTVATLVATDLLRTPGGAVRSLLPDAELPGDAWVYIYAAATLGWAAWAFTEQGVRRSVVPALGLALTVAPLQTAALSDHLSRAGVVERWRSLAKPGEPLLSYKLARHRDRPLEAEAGARPVERLGELRRALAESGGRVFAMIRKPDLVVVDNQYRRTAGGHVAVIDQRSSKVLLVSNRLGPRETDHNVLAQAVRSEPPKRVDRPTKAMLDGLIELLGADLSATEVRRGDSLDVTLHFKVRGAPARRWRIFLHLDHGSHRVPSELTDHAPVGGVYGADRWQAGDHIADTHRIELPWLSTPPGDYKLYAGLHHGHERAAVSPEDADAGDDRVFIGEIRVNSW